MVIRIDGVFNISLSPLGRTHEKVGFHKEHREDISVGQISDLPGVST